MTRWIFRIPILLILACATTFAVAWWAAWIARNDSTAAVQVFHRVQESEHITLNVKRDVRPTRAIYLATRMSNRSFRRDEITGSLRDAYDAIPEWTGLRVPEDAFASGQGNTECRWIAAFGWPYQAMFYRGRVRSLQNPSMNGPFFENVVEGGLKHGTEVEPYSEFCALPVIPLFPGFLINTLFYTAMWLGLLFAGGRARRFVRKRRGQCPKCGYTLRGERPHPQPLSHLRRERGVASADGCPECGWNRAEERA